MSGEHDIIHALRTHLDAELATQTEHLVWTRIKVLWSQPHDIHSVWVDLGGTLQQMGPREVIEAKAARERRIGLAKSEALRHCWEPEVWRETDLRMARKRLDHPGVVLEVLVTGGIRSGKTYGCTRRVMASFLYTEDSKVWVLDETETTSKRWHQGEVHHFLPPELDTATGKMKRDKTTKFNYAEGSGFTDNMFNVHWQARDENGNPVNGGGMWEHRFYGADIATLQGAELTCANSDELVPRSVCDSVRERLLSRAQDTARPAFLARIRAAVRLLEAGERLPVPLLGAIYHSTHFVSFTPKEGYSSTVADFLDGAVTVAEVPATLMPGKMVPRFKQPKKATRLIVYLHTYDNPFKGNWPGMVSDCEGKTEDEIRILAYGDIQKNWNVKFTGFKDTVHVVHDRSLIPRVGTWREVVDPAGARPWAMSWQLCDAMGKVWIVREWPQEGTDIPGIGDPGAWAISSRTGKKNGDKGPAQLLRLGWGFADYTREIWRVRMEIGAWWLAQKGTVKLHWKNRPDWTLEGSPIEVEESYMDSRFANYRSKTSGGDMTLIESMADQENALEFRPAPGDSLDEGDSYIISALSHDARRPVDALNSPALYFWHECRGHIYAMQNYCTNEFTEGTKASDEACKDFRDTTAMGLLAYPEHVSGAQLVSYVR